MLFKNKNVWILAILKKTIEIIQTPNVFDLLNGFRKNL